MLDLKRLKERLADVPKGPVSVQHARTYGYKITDMADKEIAEFSGYIRGEDECLAYAEAFRAAFCAAPELIEWIEKAIPLLQTLYPRLEPLPWNDELGKKWTIEALLKEVGQ